MKLIIEYLYRNNILVLIYSILILINLIGGLGNVPSIVIGLFSVFVACNFIRYGFNIDYFVLLIIIYLPIEILLASPEERFHSWNRLLLFISVLLSVSPLIQNNNARNFRKLLLEVLLIIITALSICSFFTYFLGINLMVRNNTNEYIGIAGHYGGLFDHSMKLGPMASISTLYLLYLGLKRHSKIILIFSALTACAVLFSASRGSFVAMVIAAMFVFVKSSHNFNNLLKIFTVSLLLITISYPVWNGALDGLKQKQTANVKAGGTFKSRLAKWDQRMTEFYSSPIYGVGFSSISPHSKEYWNKKTGTIEPGSSWLSVLSMTGLVGAILFFMFFYKTYLNIRISNGHDNNIFYVLCVFFLIHMLTEGYIFAAGNPVCVIFWLLIGCCYDNKYLSEEEINALVSTKNF